MAITASDVLVRDPTAQAIALPDGRLLIRHRGGASLLQGIGLRDLDRLLGLVDGVRTAAEIVAAASALDPPLEERAARGLLRALDGEMVRRVEMRGEETPERAPVLVVGEGALARSIEEALRRTFPAGAVQRVDRTDLAESVVASSSLVVCAIEGAPYRDLLAVQSAALAAGAPVLFVTADPDGVRVGPSAIPGVGPCLGCAQLAATRFVGLDPAARLSAAARFECGSVDAAARGWAERVVAGEALRFLGNEGGAPALAEALLLLSPEAFLSGEARRIPLARDPECPLCSGLAMGPESDLATRAALSFVERERALPRAAVASVEPGDRIESVGILGGGTAGYLTALALRRKVPNLRITLIESPDVPVIGVGEATTPLMPQFLHVDLGLDVHRLFAEVRPTLKLGIRFLWGAPEVGAFNYPFGPLRLLEPSVYGDPAGDLSSASLQSMLMTAEAVGLFRTGAGGLIPKLGTETAYHLDNRRFVAYLEARAAEAGIEHLKATVAEVRTREVREGDGGGAGGREVEALVLADGRRLSFDLYVDCTGFPSLLLEGALGSPWIGFDKSLWADRAVIGPVPHGGRFPPYTTAETYDAGWCWSIPQEEASHRGYVYSSAFLSLEEAEAEMRRKSPGLGPTRPLRFRAGRHEHFWRGNVVALGNAYGFVEPLESTSLHLLIRQIGLLVGLFPAGRRERSLEPVLNRRVGGWWDYLSWFLALHYRFNRRLDTPFWRAAREEVDISRHAELLEVFRRRGPLSYQPAIRDAFEYPDPLWGPEGIDTLLLGQGVPCALPVPRIPEGAWKSRTERMQALVARAIPQAEALDRMAADPLLLERFVEAFRAAGPAFPTAKDEPRRLG